MAVLAFVERELLDGNPPVWRESTLPRIVSGVSSDGELVLDASSNVGDSLLDFVFACARFGVIAADRARAGEDEEVEYATRSLRLRLERHAVRCGEAGTAGNSLRAVLAVVRALRSEWARRRGREAVLARRSLDDYAICSDLGPADFIAEEVDFEIGGGRIRPLVVAFGRGRHRGRVADDDEVTPCAHDDFHQVDGRVGDDGGSHVVLLDLLRAEYAKAGQQEVLVLAGARGELVFVPVAVGLDPAVLLVLAPDLSLRRL